MDGVYWGFGPNIMSSLLLIFDLDRTLILSGAKNEDETLPGFWMSLKEPDSKYYVHIRPFALELLEWMVTNSRPFGIWTAATREYAVAVLTGLFGAIGITDWRSKILTLRTRASAYKLDDGTYVKNLSLVRKSFNIKDVMLVDDDPVHGRLPSNRNSVIQAPPFTIKEGQKGNHDDMFLKQFLHAVQSFYELPRFRDSSSLQFKHAKSNRTART